MSVLDIGERTAYLHSPYFKKPEYGDFSPFYITVTICTIVVVVIFVINIVIGCCSRYSDYWNDRHTGNRWLVSLWTATPHNQPALDYTEIDPRFIPDKIVSEIPRSATEYTDVDVEFAPSPVPEQYEPKAARTEYYELQHQKSRESDI